MVSKIKPIKFYRSVGEYGFLSNLYPCVVHVMDRYFSSSEAAYQFQKPKERVVAEWLVLAPHQDILATTAHALLPFRIRENWNDVKLDIMRQVVAAKFTQSDILKDKLLATGKHPLIEASRSDAFWGEGKNGQGQNWLGRILMEVRAQLA